MDEMYRILGREHEADLEREAVKWRRAAEARSARSDAQEAHLPARRRRPALVAGLFARVARGVTF